MFSLLAAVFLSSFILLGRCSLDVQWIEPQEGEVFRSGDTIKAGWKTAKEIVSPSVKLCMASDDGQLSCGAPVRPSVHSSNGSDRYSCSLVTPSIRSGAKYLIEMRDDFGKKTHSPTFSLHPKSPNTGDNEGSTAKSATEPSSLGSSPQESSPPIPEPSPPTQFPVSVPPTVADPAPSRPPATSTSAAYLHLLAAHAPPPVVAIAVPLSVLCFVLLVAGLVSFRHWRHMKAERTREREMLKRGLGVSRNSSLSSSRSWESTWSGGYGYDEEMAYANGRTGPVPLFVPVDRYTPKPRRSTKQPFRGAMYLGDRYPLPDEHARAPSSRLLLPRINPLRSDPGANPLVRTLDDNPEVHVTQFVLADYLGDTLVPSPSLPSAPQRLHVRNQFETDLPMELNPYVNHNKPLSRNPRSPVGDQEIYEAVRRASGG